MREIGCPVCKFFLDRLTQAMSAKAQAIARLDGALWTHPNADFRSLEADVNSTRIEREEAQIQYDLHLATHEKHMNPGFSGSF